MQSELLCVHVHLVQEPLDVVWMVVPKVTLDLVYLLLPVAIFFMNHLAKILTQGDTCVIRRSKHHPIQKIFHRDAVIRVQADSVAAPARSHPVHLDQRLLHIELELTTQAHCSNCSHHLGKIAYFAAFRVTHTVNKLLRFPIIKGPVRRTYSGLGSHDIFHFEF